MEDYIGKLCLIDGKLLAKCISQNVHTRILTFKGKQGVTFTLEGDYGVEIVKENSYKSQNIKGFNTNSN